MQHALIKVLINSCKDNKWYYESYYANIPGSQMAFTMKWENWTLFELVESVANSGSSL